MEKPLQTPKIWQKTLTIFLPLSGQSFKATSLPTRRQYIDYSKHPNPKTFSNLLSCFSYLSPLSFCFDFASSRKYIFFTFFVLLALFFSFVYLVCVMQLCGFLLTQGLTLQVFSPRKFYKLLSIF